MTGSSVDPARLRAAREAAGLSQHQLGVILGVTNMTVYGWETGRRSPHPTRVGAIAEALGVTPADLVPGYHDDDDLLTLGEYRQRLGYAQAALAARLGISPTALADAELGKFWPSCAELWAETLGIDTREMRAAWWRSRDAHRSRPDNPPPPT